MEAFYKDNHNTIYCLDFRKNDLPDESVQCVVTSPPYWGLRKYSGEQELIWGDNHCEHQWDSYDATLLHENRQGLGSFDVTPKIGIHGKKVGQASFCSLCGAWKGAYGLEPTPEMYIEHTIEILREIRRVLRKDGVVFWNIGDSYASGKGTCFNPGGGKGSFSGHGDRKDAGAYPLDRGNVSMLKVSGLKPKDLCLIPFRVALEAQKPYYAGRIKSELDRVWMAAMIDSEGTICGFRHERPNGNIRTGVLVFVTNGDENILGNCDRIWLGSRYIESLKAGDKVMGATATRDCWRWQIQKAEDRSLFLREIYPYMMAKKLQVMVGWNLNEYSLMAKKMGRGGESKEVKEKREILAKILTDLNQHRPVDIPKWVKEPPSVLEPGWYVRSVIVWSKNNPMPESVTDRPTESHEYILMLTKSGTTQYWTHPRKRGSRTKPKPDYIWTHKRTGLIVDYQPVSDRILKEFWTRRNLWRGHDYYWDADAVREQYTEPMNRWGGETLKRDTSKTAAYKEMQNIGYSSAFRVGRPMRPDPRGRNIRSVWEFPTQPYPEAHFAVFPEKLPEICIKAATPEVGCCSKCGAPWERIIEKHRPEGAGKPDEVLKGRAAEYRKIAIGLGRSPKKGSGFDRSLSTIMKEALNSSRETVGWQSTCKCNADKVPSIVLDPMMGAGTTLWVAKKLNRRAAGYDTSVEYCHLTVDRCQQQILI